MQPQKHATLIKAWADGAAIQFQSNFSKEWKSVSGPPMWIESYQYRIKPKAPQIVELFAVGGEGERWRITSMSQQKANLRLSFDPDSGELLSVEKI